MELHELPHDPLSKTVFIIARDTISQIEDLLIEAETLLDKLPAVIQTAIRNAHNESASLQYCLRWGLQAAKEIRADWHSVVDDLPCDVER